MITIQSIRKFGTAMWPVAIVTVISGVFSTAVMADYHASDSVAGMTLYNNVKRNGGDYKNFTTGTAQICARACVKDNKCKSFNWGKERRDCNLKSSVPGGVPNRTVISGVKNSASDDVGDIPGEIAGIRINNNQQRRGGDVYDKFSVSGVEECARACSRERQCESFNYRKKQKECALASGSTSSKRNNKFASGAKHARDDSDGDIPGEVAGIRITNNQQRRGGDVYDKFAVGGVEECARTCSRERQCESFNYRKKQKECALASGSTSSKRNNKFASGAKHARDDSDGDIPGEVAGIRITNNQQRRGGDVYDKFPVGGVEECARTCSRERQCQSFNYRKKQEQCVLIDSASNGKRNANVISGIKDRDTDDVPDSVRGITLYDNVKRYGGDYKKFTVDSVRECAQACSRDRQCRSFNYGKEARDCNLKNNVPYGVPNRSVISGVKK